MINPQLQFGEQDIGAVLLDPKSRDDIPQLLRGLHIYTTPELRARVFAISEGVVPVGVRLFIRAILDRINPKGVGAGHTLASPETALHVRADSFVVERAYPLSFDLWKQKAALKAAKEGGVA